MSRYIDVSNLDIPSDENDYDELVAFADKVAEMITDAPSIDIVFCKECRYCLVGVATAQYSNGKQRIENLCEKHKWSVRADDFCSYGERSSE